MRPRQWTKNLVVFAALIFSRHLADGAMALASLEAFIVFCLLSGTIYLINDVADIEKDRLHERKRMRPLPSGKLPRSSALFAAGLASTVALFVAYRIGIGFLVVSMSFLVLNFLYSFWLKRIALLDVMSISVSFILRAIGGVYALRHLDPTIELSPWLLICTLFLSLFLGVCKRRHELLHVKQAGSHRESLQEYSPALLDQLVALTATGSVLSYSIYTIWPDTVANFGSHDMVYTVPLVLLGVMRYLYLVYNRDEGGSPSDLLLTERFLLIDVVVWVALVIAILWDFQ